MKIDRLLGIVVLLLNRDILPASALAERFSVSVRTIQRDMDSLITAGIPVYALPGQSGGYGIRPQYKLNHRLFSGEDFLNVLTALKGIQGSFADQRFLGSLERMYSLLPKELAGTVQEREQTLMFDFSLPKRNTVLIEKLQRIETAIARRRLLSCRYSSHRQADVVRLIEPMTLIMQWGSWYLFAFCRIRMDCRLFKVSRIHDILETGEAFVRRDKSYDEHLQAHPLFQNPNLVELEFTAGPQARAQVEECHPGDEIEYCSDGSVTVRCRQPEEDRLYRYLLSYGDAIELIRPVRVRDKLRSLAEQIRKKYE